jgi:hypothetical protein
MKYGSVRTFALSANVAVQIIGPSESRVGLLFSPPTGTGTYTVSTEPSVTLGAGLNLQAASTPILITGELFGDAIHKPWYAIADTALNVGFVETVVR